MSDEPVARCLECGADARFERTPAYYTLTHEASCKWNTLLASAAGSPTKEQP